MAEPPGMVNIDRTLGALFLGNLFAAILYGITCVQTYTYYRKEYKDHLAIKLLIFFLWILDGLHLALISYASYHYLVSNFGNISAIRSITWTILLQTYVTTTTDILIRIFFGRRVWLISNQNIILAGCIAVTSVLSFTAGFVYISKALTLGSFERLSQLSYLVYMALGSGTASDILIAVFMCLALFRNRSTFKMGRSVITVLMMYAINTCLLMTIVSIVSLITYTVHPDAMIYIGILYSHSKLHFNSLLATLNSRKALLEKLGQVVLSDTSRRDNQNEDHPTKPLSDIRFKQVVVTVGQDVDFEISKSHV